MNFSSEIKRILASGYSPVYEAGSQSAQHWNIPSRLSLVATYELLYIVNFSILLFIVSTVPIIS
jgi:hypothetical protein